MSDGRTVRMDGTEINPDELSWREFHKKPVQIEATPMPTQFTVETLEGTMEGSRGDVLICGVEGELYPCDAEIFYQTYIADETEVPQYTETELRDLADELEAKATDVDEMERATDSATAHANGVSCGLRYARDQLEELLDG